MKLTKSDRNIIEVVTGITILLLAVQVVRVAFNHVVAPASLFLWNNGVDQIAHHLGFALLLVAYLLWETSPLIGFIAIIAILVAISRD